jgi:hypothetical protein
MSENKTTQSEAQTQKAEEIAKNKKAYESEKGATETAKEKYLEAQAALKKVKPEDKAGIKTAQKSVEDAKADYLKKKEAEAQARTKLFQNGSSYVPKETEQNLYHVKLDKPAFGEKLSKEYIQKFTIAEWNQFIKNSSGLGYTMDILWNPEALKL